MITLDYARPTRPKGRQWLSLGGLMTLMVIAAEAIYWGNSINTTRGDVCLPRPTAPTTQGVTGAADSGDNSADNSNEAIDPSLPEH